ncbi:hypothetical protein YC2023_102877 [Brassica napus]|uniref:SKP1-like protein n=2 Tax=Brassica TaxID=3705 RepID=A0A816UER6_BRANA|nr:unnamed protein product [Brassica napus]
MEKEKKMIVLKSSDDESFEVDEAVVLQSQLLSHVVEDCNGPEHKIENVTGKILAKVIEYCENHVAVVVDGGANSSSAASADAIKKWDDKFIMQMDLSTGVADVIATCKDHEEIRATLGIVSDYTAEEEAEVLKENEWAFD